jgi:hypothetical protein
MRYVVVIESPDGSLSVHGEWTGPGALNRATEWAYAVEEGSDFDGSTHVLPIESVR